MSMKRVVLGLVVVLALGMTAGASDAFIFGCCCDNSCCACAPYEVKVSYTPIQPQPGECTYCTCLPYGCPDGAPIAACPPGGGCGILGGCAPCGLDLCGVLSVPCCIVGGVLDGACWLVGGILGCLGPCNPCGGAAVAAQ
jgi:hypothetical protein